MLQNTVFEVTSSELFEGGREEKRDGEREREKKRERKIDSFFLVEDYYPQTYQFGRLRVFRMIYS